MVHSWLKWDQTVAPFGRFLKPSAEMQKPGVRPGLLQLYGHLPSITGDFYGIIHSIIWGYKL